MKPFLEVEKNRVAYHQDGQRNTVHRSSLIAPRIGGAATVISFLNHFLIKRHYAEVTVKITALDQAGKVLDSLALPVDEPRVYSLNLDAMFGDKKGIGEYLIEFYSDKNLFIPFPAVMVNHVGSDFINGVHSFNRVLNDVFENDAVNKHQVYESSIDYLVDDAHDTFFSFASGPFKPTGVMEVELVGAGGRVKKQLPLDLERLCHRRYMLSEILAGETIAPSGTLRILQPKQDLFYGRMLSGIVNRTTGSFSANHSYYDSSGTGEYFDNALSRRAYPYFAGCKNSITMYPIMSPSLLKVHVEIRDGDRVVAGPAQVLESPSAAPLHIDVDRLVAGSGLTGVTAFDVVAEAVDGKVPTRVNHQLVYGHGASRSRLLSSINVSLMNSQIFTPAHKTGFTWGQIVGDADYSSRLGLCFHQSSGEAADVQVDFYNDKTLVATRKAVVKPGAAMIIDGAELAVDSAASPFLWYVATSKRPDLSGQCFHAHRTSHNASGEHSF